MNVLQIDLEEGRWVYKEKYVKELSQSFADYLKIKIAKNFDCIFDTSKEGSKAICGTKLRNETESGL